MQVHDAVIIVLGEQRSHGDNVLRGCNLNCVKACS